MAPPPVTVRFVAEILPSIKELVSLIVTSVPLARTVPKLFPLLFRLTRPVDVKLAVPVETFAAPDCIISPPTVTVRFVAVIVPRSKALVSLIVTLVPLARTVPKSFVALIRVILPTATKFAVPLTLKFVPAVCEMAPLERLTDKLHAVIWPRASDCVSAMVRLPLPVT